MYAVASDVESKLSPDILMRLTDDDGTGEINWDIVTKMIQEASAEVDAFLAMRYTLPLSPVPPILSKLTLDITLYNLFSRRGIDESSADGVIVTRYNNAVRMLEKIAAGSMEIIPPTSDTGGEAPSSSHSMSYQTAPRIFSREQMKGY
ncbi:MULTISPECIES: gp436 family protein [Brevibacillus]|uniref:gp436 family protein n=1 Tax=Brevibacillus TaxID=55080 RepID=UPI000D10D4F7|nr:MULTISPECIES: DUF1320 domain-containing protein [Brevibacillus]PSJ66963.1 DUF1320 domain-containing protein [Brevibacillus brevis]RED27758.1 phage gp36-like protein [Brevibacillus brevis]TQK42124.1 phage gp36-like protein [Brevibacillus sp. AG162]VEF86795.1 Mu-like prophage protein gp36 [Brevibacillus brevis]GEC88598.1 hypothetical protein BBR01nite_09290 [Brevibacillus brevis]